MDDLDFSKAEYVVPEAPLELQQEGPGAYRQAVMQGALGAAVGCILYAIVGHWVQIGFVSILVGIIVGRQMIDGSNGVGGRKYQWTALVLTYLSVSFAMTLDLLWVEMQQGHEPFDYAAQHAFFLVIYTLFWPVLELLTHVGYGLLGILIVFFGLQAAWRTAKGGGEFVGGANGPSLPGQQGPTTLGLR